MSWMDYSRILGNPDPSAWTEAERGNPNDPASALKVALLEVVINQRDMAALDKFCRTVISLARAARCEGRADFLWPHEEGSLEEAGYEFVNAKTEEYRREWWEALVRRALQVPRGGAGHDYLRDERL